MADVRYQIRKSPGSHVWHIYPTDTPEVPMQDRNSMVRSFQQAAGAVQFCQYWGIGPTTLIMAGQPDWPVTNEGEAGA